MFSEECQLADLLNQFNTTADTGQNRLVYSEQWVHNQQTLILLGQNHGAQAMVDDYGNVSLDFPGQEETLPIATGSHMDTVRQGGRYDGLYGVLGGFCAIQKMYQQGDLPKKPLRLISFSEEEGSRFPAAFTGSKYYTGQQQQVAALVDETGITFEQARSNAVKQLQAMNVRRQRAPLPASFTELHIEQGPRLAQAHQPIGLVTGIVAQNRYKVTVHGQANHAGTTPMAQRQDAIATASRLMASLYDLADKSSNSLTFTIGEIRVSPNVSNVIAESCTFTIDCREESDERLATFLSAMNTVIKQFDNVTVEQTLHVPATLLSQALRQRNAKIATQMKFPFQELFSGAGHDSQIMNTVVPTTMIFVPSKTGISHAPAEHTKMSDLLIGVALLTASLSAQANEA
ncbi:Zn-dependent hydrolase [Weissella fangxianensis]|uniref:Zn-dependent hydrolase n=1 Tax=Weissella fangxianensis TaxID=2953879 RepID=UPI002157C305|nr:Zn-dependent hydrolase [Weissella fangxianensis]